MTKPLHIGVTGASGYIGLQLIRSLAAKKYIVYAIGRHKLPQDPAHFIHFDLGEDDYPNLHQLDVLIHCAYDFHSRQHKDARRINFEGSLRLFQHAKTCGVKKIIFISTTSAFKDTPSYYGKIKYALEQQAKQLDIVTIRPGLVFDHQLSGILASIVKLMQKSILIPLIGKGDQQFYPCHMQDLLQLIEYTFLHPVSNHLPFVAAAEKTITFKELLLILAELNQRKVFFLNCPYWLPYSALRMLELLHLPAKLRSDSLKYLNHPPLNVDFSATQTTNISFRPFNLATLQSCPNHFT